MRTWLVAVLTAITDQWLFYALQSAVVAAGVLALVQEKLAQHRAGRGGTSLVIIRSNASMTRFWGAYLAVTSVLVATDLQVETAKDYRVLWIIVDVALVAYFCLINSWSRNWLLGVIDRIAKLEQR